MGTLIDRFGRRAIDLRVSLTDRCNLRCSYCMPAEGLPWLPKSTLLTDQEIIRLIGVAVERLGVTEVRFTGGEPLLRPGLVAIIAATSAMTPRPQSALTTNGIGLGRMAAALRDAGLDRVNISIDTLRQDRFTELTHRDRLSDVIKGIDEAIAAGLAPVKLNAVLMRGINDDEAVDLLRFALDRGCELRFVEQMPLDAQHGWSREKMITALEIEESLRREFDLAPDPSDRAGAPAETWIVNGGPARVGIVGSVTRPFCGDCDRTRLTADGQIRDCLFATTETDLRSMLRDGASDDELATVWRRAMWGKRAGHGIDEPGFLQPTRAMSAIGG
ncbi:cyclic pyranopterin phosphate synthase [Allocatelliglobosispora scoriae]|uniref:GTP 3',8-cyclase n=1 Tax=Allocatelliglobosispora scoriae TaxID=643052 RepID=A0A841BTB9_9ACTN|nr:GTP 3',8-cyclase MoaA [Allocatelliglobosispora scoriae]MBB5870945.1 cyclic pyranopterin phosphate synthase [Allocatelliglobosispora scoriae]